MLQSPHQRCYIAVKKPLRILGVWPWSVLNHVWCCTDIGTAILRKMCYRVYICKIKHLKSGWYVGLGHATLPWSCPSLSWVSLNALQWGAPLRPVIVIGIRDEPFPPQHSQDSYNQPQVWNSAIMLILFTGARTPFLAYRVSCNWKPNFQYGNVQWKDSPVYTNGWETDIIRIWSSVFIE